ncbi:MAG: response regulator transcription factor [Nocardioides sp.]
MTTVVLADDQPLVRDGLRLILELNDVVVVGEASDGAEAVAVVRALEPDVAIMDIRMPGTDGVTATRLISGLGLRTRVLVLTTFNEDRHVHDALMAGAAGFLLKDVTAAGLVEAVRRTADGEMLLAGPVLERVVSTFLAEARQPGTETPDLSVLTDRERQVLALVGLGLSNAEIAAELVISVATVKSHVRHILAKADLRDRVHAVVLAHQAGLVTHQAGHGQLSVQALER